MGKGQKSHNTTLQLVYGFLSALCFTVSEVVLLKTRHYIHHSIDTIYVALALVLILPSCLFSDYSRSPAKYMIDG